MKRQEEQRLREERVKRKCEEDRQRTAEEMRAAREKAERELQERRAALKEQIASLQKQAYEAEKQRLRAEFGPVSMDTGAHPEAASSGLPVNSRRRKLASRSLRGRWHTQPRNKRFLKLSAATTPFARSFSP